MQTQFKLDVDDISRELKELVKSDNIVRFKLLDGAKKVLIKMITEYGLQPEKFFTLAEIRRNFRSLTTQDAEIIVFELRDLNLLEGKVRGKSTLVFRYNYLKVKQENLLGQDRQQKLERFIEDRTQKRIDFHEKMLNKLRAKNQAGNEPSSDDILANAEIQALEGLAKTALELHEAKECDPSTCRFCGFGIGGK